MDFHSLESLVFGKPDCQTFKCLQLAFEAGKTGGTMPCVMNAANEVAVAKFLKGQISYLEIPEIVEAAMSSYQAEIVQSLEQLTSLDQQVRNNFK